MLSLIRPRAHQSIAAGWWCLCIGSCVIISCRARGLCCHRAHESESVGTLAWANLETPELNKSQANPSQRTGNRKLAQSDVYPPIGGVVQEEECDPSSPRLGLVNKQKGRQTESRSQITVWPASLPAPPLLLSCSPHTQAHFKGVHKPCTGSKYCDFTQI